MVRKTRPSKSRAPLSRREIAAGRVTVLTKANSGKADALDYGLEQVTEEIFVGIDADTLIAPDAISQAGAALQQSQSRPPWRAMPRWAIA